MSIQIILMVLILDLPWVSRSKNSPSSRLKGKSCFALVEIQLFLLSGLSQGWVKTAFHPRPHPLSVAGQRNSWISLWLNWFGQENSICATWDQWAHFLFLMTLVSNGNWMDIFSHCLFSVECQHISCGLFTLFEVTSKASQETLYRLL